MQGNNIGRGYWERPEETRLTFGAKLRSRLTEVSHADGSRGEGTWLRTGDLGVYLDGELYVTGRIADLVIIDGRNHYPQDIEATTAEASPTVRRGYVTAFSVPANELPGSDTDDTSERLVIVPNVRRAPVAPIRSRRSRRSRGSVAPTWATRARRALPASWWYPAHHQRQAGRRGRAPST